MPTTLTYQSTPPAPGRRPGNRSQLITAAATELFHRRGYAATAMTDIAAAVNVQPSALYRHFSSKDALLAQAIRVALQPLSSLLSSGASLNDAVLRDIVRVSLANRATGALWQREARHLDPAKRAAAREDLRGLARLIAARAVAGRPDLTDAQADHLAWSVMAVLGSVSFHTLALPDSEMQELFEDMLRRIFLTQFPTVTNTTAGNTVVPAGLRAQSRRETILSAASRLFGERGYSAVTIDDIGDAAGIAGPSIYNHFSSKQGILGSVLTRANEWLWMELTLALAAASDPRDGIGRLQEAYLCLAMNRGELMSALLIDLGHLPDDIRQALREAQHEYIGEWVALLRRIRPELDSMAARIEVQAAFMIVSAVAQTPHLRRSTDAIPWLRATMTGLLVPRVST